MVYKRIIQQDFNYVFYQNAFKINTVRLTQIPYFCKYLLEMKITETDSAYNNLEKMSFRELLENINYEDHKVPEAIKKVIPQIEKLVEAVYEKLSLGGKLFFLGAGTSGRLAIVDASECPPTFGVDKNLVIGIIAGGDIAIRYAVEHAEDDFDAGWNDLLAHSVSENDFVIGISSSGTTPYVLGALQHCAKHKISTGSITSNSDSPIVHEAVFSIVVNTGAEFVTGSTRMKSGTAQKLILNMISTSVMIKLGRVLDNKMVDMQLNNNKLIDRGTKMIESYLLVESKKAKELLLECGSVRKVLEKYLK
jgi:N-acetylmuramic acid 6-phosphate etherase